ncbi:DUF4173 domain-containing protein [Micromonospora soli]|uniref:DUF4153 domain-containing protein n=1 Tax=Micromonospora sp. NBRC 110009 TaxID=3061627 RepID=UPI002671ADD8|nr:DUF4153 domain-containing protein [Micromonospora sp. NBRC 110009]WKU00002.1 DUF4173 domain-containing protein [Micromonospora sp. NBRC 110009]
MSEPQSAPDSPPTAPAAGDTPPYLLVMPTMEGAPPAVAWPGQEGQPAWAIPVVVPPGTRGYALFVPLVPAGEGQPVAVPDQSAAPRVTVPAPGVPTQATPPAVEGTAAPTPPDATGQPASRTTAEEPSAPPAPTGAGTTDPATPVGPAAARPTTKVPDAGTPGAETTPPSSGTAPPAAAPGQPAPWSAGPPPGHPAAPPYAGPPPVPQPWGHYPPGTGWTPRPATPRTSFLGARWPGPKPANGRAVPLAVLAGALGTAFFVPLSRVGVGWFLGWLTLTLGVLVAVRRRSAGLPRTERLIRGGWAAAALALLAVLAFRNAWWLVTFCVLGALGCATLAIVGGRLVRSILFGLVATPFAAFRGLPWVRRHVTASPDAGTVRRVAGSVIATVLVLLVFGALLASADAAFNEVLGAIVSKINISTVFRWIFLAAVGGLIAVAAVYTLAAPPDLSTVDRPTSRRLGLLEWAPAIGALTLLFAGFVVVQFTVLFGGQRHVQKVAGLSYSEYARSGFWQLLFVTLLTLAVLAGVSRWASRERPVDQTLLRVLLGLLSVLSVVIVVSALSRMWTYQKVYSFTGERIFVMAFELLLGVVFLMVLAAGVRWQGRWIPGTTVALAVVMLLGLAVLNPEDYAAHRNIARYQQSGKIDAWYLRALSADATPALTQLPDPVRRCTLSWIAEDLDESDPWYAWNLGRYRARQALDRVGPDAVGGPKDCRRADQFDLPKTRGTR